MAYWLEALISLLVLLGAGFVLIGSIGLARLPDFYTRLHGPTKASTLGVGCAILASVLFFSALRGSPSLQEVLIVVFLFLTTPVSAHLLARAAMHRNLPRTPGTRGRPWGQ